MILAYKPQFVQPILKGEKIHTIREDKHNRWKPGRKIQQATGVRTKEYNCFSETRCLSIQTIQIIHTHNDNISTKTMLVDNKIFGRAVYQNCKLVFVSDNIELLSQKDGFTSINEFFEWFDTAFTGKIIHWTTFKY